MLALGRSRHGKSGGSDQSDCGSQINTGHFKRTKNMFRSIELQIRLD